MTFGRLLPYLYAVGVPLLATLLLTPLVREMNRRLGIVDRPDPRRINKTPVPRGGGIALVLGVVTPMLLFVLFGDAYGAAGISPGKFVRLSVLAYAIALWGYADDRFALAPKAKLLGQIAIAVLVWAWADLGFRDVWPSLPAWLDCALTVFWIVGAVNAFNLIDGLDGLASGLALIASLGMAGALFFLGKSAQAVFYLAFAGGLLAFLRYNWNPASVFLGDSGSMFIGFVLAVLPLLSHTPNSFLVSVGVPLLAMGVPIFDTALAIFRRLLRRLLGGKGGRVMGADTDHLHHRILRSVGLSQRKAAWTLYGVAAFLVAVGLVGLTAESRSAGLWIFFFTVVALVAVKDMMRVEFFDAGRLLDDAAHNRDTNARRRWARLAVPALVLLDLLALAFVQAVCLQASGYGFTRASMTGVALVRIACTFTALVFFRAYRTVWARAVVSNYVRLIAACFLGSAVAALAIGITHDGGVTRLVTTSLLFAALSATLLSLVRLARAIVRDFYYASNTGRLVNRKDVSRVLVYGAGLRYSMFRRDLVRRTGRVKRIIVGLLDDDILLRNHYIGGIRVLGTLSEAPDVILAMNADTVVVACDVDESWMKIVRQTLAPTGVRITRFTYSEEELTK